MKTIVIILLTLTAITAQSFKVEKTSGKTFYRTNNSDEWIGLETGNEIPEGATISTGENSTLTIVRGDVKFILRELSAVSVSNIKSMSVDDFLLALALEDVLNAPTDTNKYSENTAVYGTRESNGNSPHIKSDDFGIKRLNGAVRLAELGFKESAVVAARETYRKYPDTKKLISYRIFFADILFEKRLYEEALTEYTDIGNYKMSVTQKKDVEEKLDLIKKKMLSN